MSTVRIVVFCVSRRGGSLSPLYYFPRTKEGLAKAKAKRSELLARFLDGEVIMELDNA